MSVRSHRSGESSLDPLLSYLASGSLRVRDLLPGFKPSELPTVFDSLASAAHAARIQDLQETMVRPAAAYTAEHCRQLGCTF